MTRSSMPSPAERPRPDGSRVRVALVVSRFNHDVSTRLLAGAEACLEQHGCTAERRRVIYVPGAFEVPQAARKLALSGKYDAIIGLGAVIRGETAHFEYVAGAAAQGLAQVGLETGVPTAFGVLTTETLEQAMARAGSGADNKGWEAAVSALEMAGLFRELGGGKR
jgi:6,7-dimethyl-8-ribityllumazine synthase